MAENGSNRISTRNSPRRIYPGTANRLLPISSSPTNVSISNRNSSNSNNGTLQNRNIGIISNIPGVFSRPLSRSQLSGVSVIGIENCPISPCPPSPPARPISLDQPRPNSERHRNLYLGAPLPIENRIENIRSTSISSPTSSGRTNDVNSSTSAKILRENTSITAADQVRLPTNSRKYPNICSKELNENEIDHNLSRSDIVRSNEHHVITLQPTKRGLLDRNVDKLRLGESSIVCPYCRKCRCEACSRPRALPSRWICSKSIQCGAEPILDYLTCLCCIKALFYHCGKNVEGDGGVLCADKPCSCGPHRKFWRWGCMTGMSIILPCLCFYWPCKMCLSLIEKTYQKYHNNGCQCKEFNGNFNSTNEHIHELSEDEDPQRLSNHFHSISSNIPSNNTNIKLLSSSPTILPSSNSTSSSNIINIK